MCGIVGVFNLNNQTVVTCTIPENFLNDDVYQICLYVHNKNMNLLYINNELLVFEVKDVARENAYLGKVNGFLRPKLDWNVYDN